MKAKELMIGDWVMVYREGVADCGQYFEWQEVGHVIGLGDKIITVQYSDEEETETEEDIKPIPITPEILEKNGWKVKKGFVQHGNFGDGPLMLWHTEGNKILRNFTHELEISDLSTDKGFRVRIECNYVHELQHALRLCRIKKEIIL